MAGTDGRTGGLAATVDLDSVERMSRMDKNGRARSPADLMANWRAAWGADARVLQAGIRADDIRQAAFPTGSRNLRRVRVSGAWPALRMRTWRVRGRLPLRGQHRLARSARVQPGRSTSSRAGGRYPAPCFPLNCSPCVEAASTWNVREC